MMMRVGLLAAIAAASLVPVSPASAQPASDTWHVTVEPYLMGAAMSGTSGVKGFEAELEMSASDILSNLEFGAMGMFGARKGNWGVGADLIYMSLGATTDRPAADLDFSQSAFALYGLRRISDAAEATFGIRANGADGSITFKEQSLAPAGTAVSQSKWWFDPIVGLRLHSNSPGRFNAEVYGEVGGFGVGSDFAWQLFPVVSIRMTERTSLDAGYRWIDVNYADGEGAEFTWDVLSQGPVIGFRLQF
jgi:hypothetical protein